MYDTCSGQFPVVFDRNLRVLSSAQAQFVTVLFKLILTQAQPEKYHYLFILHQKELLRLHLILTRDPLPTVAECAPTQ